MTEQRIRRLRTKIQESRARLLDAEPFFALLLMYVRFVAVTDIKTISTNGRCVFFAPNYIEKLYPKELDYILCHQIMHIICADIWRTEDLAGDNYHFACDVRLNILLRDEGFSEKQFPHLGIIHRMVPGFKDSITGLSPAENYRLLPFDLYWLNERTGRRWLPDCDDYWDRKSDDGHHGTTILDIADEDGMLKRLNEESASGARDDEDESIQGSKQIWQSRAKAIEKSLSIGDGENDMCNIPDDLKRLIKKAPEPRLDWKKILNSFLREQICDYSFLPPDRRFSDTDFFLPDFNEKEFVSRDILFMIDTSGSVEDDALSEVYAEIKGAIEQFNGKLSGMLGFFDADVKPALPFQSVNDLTRIVPVGGGGTDFRPVFDYIQKTYREEKPACIVIFTDGMGPYPNERAAMGIPVLWLINNAYLTPPWGKTIRILPAIEEE